MQLFSISNCPVFLVFHNKILRFIVINSNFSILTFKKPTTPTTSIMASRRREASNIMLISWPTRTKSIIRREMPVVVGKIEHRM